MPLRRAFAAVLLCALPIAHAFAAEPAAAPTVKWMLPWTAGTTLEYAYEDLTTKDMGGRERTRSTSTATVRISEVLDKGFVQTWSFRDDRYVVEEGDKAEEAAMRKISAALQDAASVAGLLITTEAAVSEMPDDKPAMPMGGGGGMGGMGGMDF